MQPQSHPLPYRSWSVLRKQIEHHQIKGLRDGGRGGGVFVEGQGISLRLEGQTNTSGIGPGLIRHAAHGGSGGGGGSGRSGGTSRQHQLLLYLEKRGKKKPCLLKKV